VTTHCTARLQETRFSIFQVEPMSIGAKMLIAQLVSPQEKTSQPIGKIAAFGLKRFRFALRALRRLSHSVLQRPWRRRALRRKQLGDERESAAYFLRL